MGSDPWGLGETGIGLWCQKVLVCPHVKAWFDHQFKVTQGCSLPRIHSMSRYHHPFAALGPLIHLQTKPTWSFVRRHAHRSKSGSIIKVSRWKKNKVFIIDINIMSQSPSAPGESVLGSGFPPCADLRGGVDPWVHYKHTTKGFRTSQ